MNKAQQKMRLHEFPWHGVVYHEPSDIIWFVRTPASEETRREQKIAFRCIAALILYLLSTGPVAWATNDGLHPAYLPDQVNYLYLPLVPLMKIEQINNAFYFYTAVLWGGYPAGYTTL